MKNDKQQQTANGGTCGTAELSDGLGVLEMNMDTLVNAQKLAEYWKAESMAATKEIESLRAQVAELTGAFTVIWVNDDRAAWDGKAVEHFDALLAKVGGSDTATPNVELSGREGKL